MLQRNTPLPSRIAGRCPSERREWFGARAGHGHCAVAWQPMTPILVSGLESLLDQQAAEPRTVDKEIGLNDAAVLKGHGRDVAAFVQADLDDPALRPDHAVLLGHAAEVFGVERRIELKGDRKSVV